MVHNETSATVRVGDAVIRTPETITEAEPRTHKHSPMRGRVVYVHPLGRFHVVEFGEGARAVRESFAGAIR